MLVKIIEKKKEDLRREKRKGGRGNVSSWSGSDHDRISSNRFYRSVSTSLQNDKRIALIAEVKFASPTNPNLDSSEQLLDRVRRYEQARASAISIITEKHFFKGDPSFVTQVKEVVSLPVLQKDFVIDRSQIYEAKAIGSDALLLIARLVDKETLQRFVLLTKELGMDPVVEIASEEDLKKALTTDTDIIAVNARDLDTFIVSVETACALLKKVPDSFITLGFSGIHSAKEVILYKKAGAHGVLVGTSLMQAKNIQDFIQKLL
ncbi:MAG: indole-3-glycerol-phosphate synthase [Patescibacteria group bacterium]